MPTRTSKTGSELFIVDNSDSEWKVHKYLHDWCQLSKQSDIATGYFKIGSLLALDGEWQKVDNKAVQCLPETPRICKQAQQELVEIRQKLDKHLNKTYLRKVQAPVGVKPVLRAWMELSQ